MQTDTRIPAVVKMWDSAKGYGFLRVDGEVKDVFVHHRELALPGRGRRDLVAGQAVTCLLRETEKGVQASRVTIVDAVAPCPTCGRDIEPKS